MDSASIRASGDTKNAGTEVAALLNEDSSTLTVLVLNLDITYWIYVLKRFNGKKTDAAIEDLDNIDIDVFKSIKETSSSSASSIVPHHALLESLLFLTQRDSDSSNFFGLTDIVASVALFINASILLHQDNHIAIVIGFPDGSSELVYTSSKHNISIHKSLESSVEKAFTIFLAILQEYQDSTTNSIKEPLLNRPLSMGLCYINRIIKKTALGETGIQKRILAITPKAPSPKEMVQLTKITFAAAKSDVSIDVLDLSLTGSTLLVQLANETGGIFLQPNYIDAESISQYLFSLYLPDMRTRKLLAPPNQPSLDLRAPCFCHGDRLVDIGWTCSVCLSVFCLDKKSNRCQTCSSRVYKDE